MEFEKHSFNFYWPKVRIYWREWLPTKGNVIFTLLVISSLFWAQQVGAISLNVPAAANTSVGTIAYQGRLADTGGAPLTGTYNMIFRLHATVSGGTPLREEQWTGSNSVQVSDGLFNVMLGSLTPIAQTIITGNSNLFLGISVGTDAEMTPRVQLGSVPFATQALTVPDGSITKAKLASGVNLEPPDGSITSRKVKLDAGQVRAVIPGQAMDLTTTAQTIPGTTFTVTPDTNQTYLLFVTVDFEIVNSVGVASLFVDGASLPDISAVLGGSNVRSTGTAIYRVNLNAGSHTLHLAAAHTGGTTARIWDQHTTITYFAVAQ